MGRAALQQVTSRDPSRAALADAIADLMAKRKARDEAQACLDALETKRAAAWSEIDAAETAIADAKLHHREEIMASVTRGDTFPENGRLAEAEQRLALAKEQNDSLREAKEAFRSDLTDREQRIHWAEREVEQCARAVMWEAVPALLREAEPIRLQFRQIVETLAIITGGFPGSPSADDPIRELQRQAEALTRPILMNVHDRGATGLAAEWKAVAERLHTDPDTPLPTIG